MGAIEETNLNLERAAKYFRRSIIIALIVTAAAAVAGGSLSPYYLWGAALGLLPAGVAVYSYIGLRRLKILLGLRKRWAAPVGKRRDFNTISMLQGFLARDGEQPGMIDSQTWRDLNGDQIYALLDRTFTAPGQAVLNTILKNPCFEQGTLKKRSRKIKLFQVNACFREQFQTLLLPLERVSDTDVASLLWGELPPPSPYASLFTLLALGALISLSSPLFLGKYSVLFITGMLAINSLVHSQLSKKFQYTIPAISALAVLLRTASKISRQKNPGIRYECRELGKAVFRCKSISKNIAYLQPKLTTSEIDFLYEYLKLFFLLEVRAFYKTLSELGRQVEQLRKIYLLVGELDALQSVASYREGLPEPGYVEPDLMVEGEATHEVRNVRHPLLKDAVPNSILMGNEGILITGSNMSGKSTFLRTVGINALFAQTIYTCLASSYRGSFLRVITSISREDNLMEGKSFYYQEAERLLRLIQTAARGDAKVPALCIIDELLSGTNYIERFAASQGILSYLAHENALVLAATHDLDLAEKLQGLYRCYHFTDQVREEGLIFDFKLKEGIATTRNAIRLLEYLEYPAEIVSQAHRVAGEGRYGD